MLVIWVICSVIVFTIYIVIKFQVDEWLNESRMSKQNRKKVKKSKKSSWGDISEETDSTQGLNASVSNTESTVASCCNQNSDEAIRHRFEKSTDTSESEEDRKESVFKHSKPNTRMFCWSDKNPKPEMDEVICLDSDSSDEFMPKSEQFHHQQMNKKCKTYHRKQLEEKSETKEDISPEVIIQYDNIISGIKVKFPVKPYSCQMAVMNKVIQGCTKSENCLLESPTGTGKTLALLCSVLAWHDHHIAEIEKENGTKMGGGDAKSVYNEGYNDLHEMGGSTSCMDEMDLEDLCYDAIKKHAKIPKIYYGTRTHKQIEQVIRELRTTSYQHKKMTILSSREHTCIQDSTRNKTELCKDLLDPVKHIGCPFYTEKKKDELSNFNVLSACGLGPIWDIEELVEIGKEREVCPYFTARDLMKHADIIFCPYNYIIDPDIRESMQLDLQDEVIILDEAHNMEDICRDVASVDFRDDHMMAAALECEALSKQREMDFSVYNILKQYITKLVTFMKSITLNLVGKTSETKSSPYWTGKELLELFDMHGLGEETYHSFFAASTAAIADLNNMKEEVRMKKTSQKPVISSNTKLILEHLVFSMRTITSPKYTDDYRACIMENIVKDYTSFQTNENSWLPSNKQEHTARTLKLICMNPGVIFAPLSELARAIILVSGTLAPIDSFQSELGTKFPHVLNAGHVISKDQIYATCLSRGPNGIVLKANYQNVNTWTFQDELGSLLLQICEAVPHGILCFFSSYNVLNIHMQRWKHTSVWDKIGRIKELFVEPRYGGDLGDIMRDYRQVIEDTSAGPSGGISGALLLAVFRGKVAEGIDFKDNESRCVLSIGIPYTVRNDPIVDMKYKYNDANISKGLLSGYQWYSIQAFRALNQALGRCLRHVNDWGAVILVDERFLMKSYKENLPKWVKTMMVNPSNCNLKEELRNFVAQRKKNERKS